MTTGNLTRKSPGLRVDVRDAFTFACFVFFLYPISIDGLSVNYSFMLYPAILIMLKGKFQKPSDLMLLIIVFYVLLFVAASLFQNEFIEYWPRRAISFILFISMFAFAFISIDERMVRAFVAAVIAISLYFSLQSIALFVTSGGADLHFEAKDIVGSQRFGFILIIAFWLVYLSAPLAVAGRAGKLIVLVFLVVGIALTFSRASIIAWGVSIAAYLVWSIQSNIGLPAGHLIKNVGIVVVGTLVVLFLMNALFPVTLEFFEIRLFEFLRNTDIVENNLADAATSEGTRVFIWKRILESILSSPFFGYGYLGVWTLDLFGYGGGSAHSQYMDVLFRTGIIGLVLFIYMLVRAMRYLYFAHRALYWGLFGVVIYGFFHETFKESHGGFVLAFLFGLASQAPLSGSQRARVSE